MRISDRTIQRLVQAERAALIITRPGCESCRIYLREIVSLVRLGMLPDVAIGQLSLHRPGAAGIMRAHPWMVTLQVLPFTVLYRRGEPVEQFAAARASYLLRRIQVALFEVRPADGAE